MPLPPLRAIAGVAIPPKLKASCHCGAVVLELRKGAIMGAVPLEGLRVLQGQESLSVYRFNTMTAEHYFCSRCGIYTHHRRRSRPNQYGYNLGCLEGIDATQLRDVPVSDGVNHMADRREP